MKKIVKNEFKYFFDEKRKNNRYSIDGISWYNHGNIAEYGSRFARGLPLHNDGNTPYDAGADIQETCTSVKSYHFTLTSRIIGNDKNSIIEKYMNTVYASNFDYTVINSDRVTIYNMNASEFYDFLNLWTEYDERRKIVRGKRCEQKIIEWLEKRLE